MLPLTGTIQGLMGVIQGRPSGSLNLWVWLLKALESDSSLHCINIIIILAYNNNISYYVM